MSCGLEKSSVGTLKATTPIQGMSDPQIHLKYPTKSATAGKSLHQQGEEVALRLYNNVPTSIHQYHAMLIDSEA